MHRKAQVEFIIIVGLLVVVVSVIYFAYQTGVIFPSPVSSAVSQEQKTVKDSVENIIRKGADEAIKWLEAQGGYIVPPLNDSVSFTRIFVPYWQKCDDTYIPDLKTDITPRLETVVENYIRWSINETGEIYGKDVSFNLTQLSVDANILANQIDISVNLPTSVQNYSIQQPYRVTIPTKFGEIYGLARNYAEEAAKNRYLELFILNSMYFSKTIDEGGIMHSELPTIGVLILCGETIYRTPEQLSSALENIIGYTLSHIIWWRPTITDPQQPKVYGVENLNGKTYPQLNPLFQLPDDFEIPIQDGIALINPAPLLTSRILTTSGLCMGTYYIQYSFTFPVVLRVHDDLTGYDFNIATLVDVGEMIPGNCMEHAPSSVCISTPSPTGGETVCTTNAPGEPSVGGIMGCTNATCLISIRVLKSDGTPVRNARVVFGNCILNKTDSEGETSGFVACDKKDLYMHYLSETTSEQLVYSKCEVTPSEASGTYVVYDEYTNITVKLYQVKLTRGFRDEIIRGPSVPVTHKVLLTFKSHGCEEYENNIIVDPSMISICSTGNTDECLAAMRSAEIEDTVSVELQPGRYGIEAEMIKDDAIIGTTTTSYDVSTADSTIEITIEYWG